MAFPRKFKHLLEIELQDVTAPDEVILTYAVCAVEKGSCGWGGWYIECAFSKGKLINAMDEQICPRCGKPLYRTGASVRFESSKNQTFMYQEGVNYESDAIEYDDD
jgi:hypothetical protein